MKRQCHDTFGGDRCAKALGHVDAGDDLHQHGVHQWGSRDYPAPLWRSRPLPAKEMRRETHR